MRMRISNTSVIAVLVGLNAAGFSHLHANQDKPKGAVVASSKTTNVTVAKGITFKRQAVKVQKQKPKIVQFKRARGRAVIEQQSGTAASSDQGNVEYLESLSTGSKDADQLIALPLRKEKNNQVSQTVIVTDLNHTKPQVSNNRAPRFNNAPIAPTTSLNMTPDYIDRDLIDAETGRAPLLPDSQSRSYNLPLLKRKSWSVDSAETLRDTLKAWAESEGYVLSWEAQDNVGFGIGATVYGSFEEVVPTLLESVSSVILLQSLFQRQQRVLVVREVKGN